MCWLAPHSTQLKQLACLNCNNSSCAETSASHSCLTEPFLPKMLGTLWHDVTAGVIWRGDSVIDGVPETLDMLRGMVRFQKSLSLANKPDMSSQAS